MFSSPLYRWKAQGTEMLRHSPKVTQGWGLYVNLAPSPLCCAAPSGSVAFLLLPTYSVFLYLSEVSHLSYIIHWNFAGETIANVQERPRALESNLSLIHI